MYDRPEISFLDDRLASHRARAFTQLLWGPMHRQNPGFGVVRFEAEEGGPDLLVTTAITRGHTRRSFVSLDDTPGARPVSTLTAFAWWYVQAHVPAPPPGGIVPIGEPWVPGSNLTHVAVSWPLLFGDAWRGVSLPEQRWSTLWIQAVRPEEAWIAREMAASALVERAARSGVRLKAA